MRKAVFTFFTFFVLIAGFSQNIILNGDFEELREHQLADSLGLGNYNREINFDCKYWTKLNRTTPDYWHNGKCANLDYLLLNPFNYSPFHISGKSCIGFIPITWDGAMEPLVGEFKVRLEKGVLYEISFFYRFGGPCCKFQLDALDIYISRENWVQDNHSLVDYTHIVCDSIKSNVKLDGCLINDNQWHCINGKYRAIGDEKYVAFGIFFRNRRFIKKIIEFQSMYLDGREGKERDFFNKNQEILILNEQYSPCDEFKHEGPYYFIDKIQISPIWEDVHTQDTL